MRKTLIGLIALALVAACVRPPVLPNNNNNNNNNGNQTENPSEKLSGITYQLLIYSFADSDGDGVGDFKGIQNKLDYLDAIGATALWLSPAHPTSSYHAYDVNDYYSLNPLYAVGEKTSEKAEADFKELLAAAHQKGIAIYMDYVLNHSGKNNPWFQEALADPSSKYRDYYFFSSNPSSDYKNFPMLKGTSYNSGEWKQVTSGSPKLTINKTTESVTNGTDSWNLYMWQDGVGDKTVKFVKKSDGTYYIVMDINGNWGLLVRKYPNWDAGSKFGAKSGNTTLKEGTPLDLVADGQDISFSGSGCYKIELTNVSTETLYYMGCFSDWMPDLNYGDVSTAENNACFKDLAASADKWLNMGVDGFRLDAVKHICGGIGSYNNSSNITLLGKWYDHCNATSKAAGHSDNIFMVAEAWDGHNIEKTYYKGLTSCFEFDFGYKLRDALKSGNASGFAAAVAGFVSDHSSQRADAVTSFFLSNHDQNRFSTEIGKDINKQKVAGAVLLTVPGKPFIYQGEELGYWGSKDGGDEYVRTPIMWDKAGTQCAKQGVNNKVDNSMLTASISVEAQEPDNSSILNVYRKFAAARNSSKALAKGNLEVISSGNNAVAAWKMSYDGETVVVAHNFSSSVVSVNLAGCKTSDELVTNGVVSSSGTTVTLGAYSSVVFKQ
ncbi:MAG: alpha-amylase [Bacteroidales bacterium]|nr:alpha-amylase [Bacteroidales bacterium]